MKLPGLPAAAGGALITSAALLLVACGAPQATPSAGGTQSTIPSAGPTASRTATPSPAPTIGLLPASPQLSDQLILDRTTVVAGMLIHGTLIVTYRGSRPLNLTKTCRPDFAVVLTNRRFPPRVAFAAVCIMKPFTIKPGVNRFPFTVRTGYLSCAQTGQSSGIPTCLSTPPIMPPLPAGHYHAVLVGDGLALPPPAPVPVTVVSPHVM